MKCLVLKGYSPELRTNLIEHTVWKLSLDKLSDLDIAFQDAHRHQKKSLGHGSSGKPGRLKSGFQYQLGERMPSSTQVLKLTAVAENVARLVKMDICKR